MLKILRGIFSLIVIVFAGYGLITRNFDMMAYMMLFMGAMFLIMGVDEIKENRKTMGIFSILTSGFVFYVSFQGFN